MRSRARWGLLGLLCVAGIIGLLFFWKWTPNHFTQSSQAAPLEPALPEVVSEADTIPRASASLTPSQIYRKALQAEDAARHVPTWEDMNRDRPAEF